MSEDFFRKIINDATDFGYDTFGLTPLTGEVLTDKTFVKKLLFMENHPKVKEYSFCTNFTLADKDIIDFLTTTKKLNTLFISIYGHSKDTFVSFSGSKEEFFRQLLKNLKYLLKKSGDKKFKIDLGIRTEADFDLEQCSNELCQTIKTMRDKYHAIININKTFNNWGGHITNDDIKDLNITINKPLSVYKKGPCSLIFYKNIVLADGRINACACRDVDATMVIGDLKTQSFGEIYSLDNDLYMDLIGKQQKNIFNPVCESCDFYRSILKYHRVYKNHSKRPITFKKFLRTLSTDHSIF